MTRDNPYKPDDEYTMAAMSQGYQQKPVFLQQQGSSKPTWAGSGGMKVQQRFSGRQESAIQSGECYDEPALSSKVVIADSQEVMGKLDSRKRGQHPAYESWSLEAQYDSSKYGKRSRKEGASPRTMSTRKQRSLSEGHYTASQMNYQSGPELSSDLVNVEPAYFNIKPDEMQDYLQVPEMSYHLDYASPPRPRSDNMQPADNSLVNRPSRHTLRKEKKVRLSDPHNRSPVRRTMSSPRKAKKFAPIWYPEHSTSVRMHKLKAEIPKREYENRCGYESPSYAEGSRRHARCNTRESSYPLSRRDRSSSRESNEEYLDTISEFERMNVYDSEEQITDFSDEEYTIREIPQEKYGHHGPSRESAMEIPTFDGVNQPLSDWLAQVDICIEENCWPDAKAARRVACKLRGDAASILPTMTRRDSRNYHKLVRALKKRYETPGMESAHSIELMSTKYQKKKHGDLPRYAQSMRVLARRAYPGSRISERQLADFFCRSLPKAMRKQVQVARPASLDAALCMALTVQATDELFSDDEKPRKPRIENVNAVQSNTTDEGKKTTGYYAKRKNGSPTKVAAIEKDSQDKDSNILSMLQNLTNLVGKVHDKAEKQAQQIEALEKKTQRRPLSEVTCYTCNVKGHVSRYCPQKKQEVSSTSNLSPAANPFKPYQTVAMVHENEQDETSWDNQAGSLNSQGSAVQQQLLH